MFWHDAKHETLTVNQQLISEWNANRLVSYSKKAVYIYFTAISMKIIIILINLMHTETVSMRIFYIPYLKQEFNTYDFLFEIFAISSQNITSNTHIFANCESFAFSISLAISSKIWYLKMNIIGEVSVRLKKNAWIHKRSINQWSMLCLNFFLC